MAKSVAVRDIQIINGLCFANVTAATPPPGAAAMSACSHRDADARKERIQYVEDLIGADALTLPQRAISCFR